MTKKQYREILECLALTQGASAKVLGVDARTSRKWANGERPVDETAARFLHYLVQTQNTEAYRLLMKRYAE